MTTIFEANAVPTPVDAGSIERQWRAEGFSFGVFRDPPGQEWNNFVHDTDEYVIVAAGELIIDVDDMTARCRAGDLVRIPRGAVHSLKTVSAEGSTWYYGYGNWENE